ncbi:MAG: hypothetical protein J3R72DRAFT_496497 [Linnemannia gamsii]|nr:MAG: hypothetical protein J3R72DRAFT_496497 [Linnemannia gamsii]
MALHRRTRQQDNTATTTTYASPLKMRRILSLTVVACLALSLTTAKPIYPTNNNHAPHRSQQQQHQQQARNILNHLSTSWSSFTTPLNSLHAISGAANPANSASELKMLHKRGVNNNNKGKKPTTGTSGGISNSNKKKVSAVVVDKATAQAKHTYSAYEAIVNSDSQMPVFLNQHHHPKSKGKAVNGKATLLAAAGGAVSEKGESRSLKKAGMVTPIDILRQTGTKKPTAAAASVTLSAEEEERERERKKVKEELEGTSPAIKKHTTDEGTTPAKDNQSKSNNSNTNKTSANRARDAAAVVAAAVEDGTSTIKTLFDTIFAHGQQQPSRRTAESNTATGAIGEKEDSEDFKAIKETINAVAHAAVAAAASSHHLEERDTAGVLQQALENIAHKIEEAATAAIALEIPSLTDHTLGSSSSSVLDDKEVLKSTLPENHQDTIIDDEGAVDLPVVSNNNNHGNNAPAPKHKPGVIFVNDNEYSSDENDDDPHAYTYSTYSNPSTSSEYSDTLDEWRLPDEDDYMAQYVHRAPQSFPGSESILFTGTVLQRTLASSALLLVGFVVLLGFISYKMYARRRNTSPWAFLHYMTFGIFTSLFYDSTTLSNSTLNAYTTNGKDSSSTSSTATATMRKGAWLRRGSLTRSSTSGTNNIMSSPAEKEPLLPEPVVASSASSFSFKKSGPFRTTELRRTSTAQHHQMQIELALQQQQQQQQHHGQQQRQEQQQQQQQQWGSQFHNQHQQAEMEHLQKSFMRRTSI